MKQLLALFLFLPFTSFAQKIKQSNYDRFEKKLVIETSNLLLKQDKNAVLITSLRSVGKGFFITLKGFGNGASTIKAGDEVHFILDNDSTVKAKSTSAQDIENGKEEKTYEHEYAISTEGLQSLGRYNLKQIVKFGNKGKAVIDIPEENYFDLRKACLLLFSEYTKKTRALGLQAPDAPLAVSKTTTTTTTPAPPVRNVVPLPGPSTTPANTPSTTTTPVTQKQILKFEDIIKNMGDTVLVCGKVFTGEYQKQGVNKPTILKVGVENTDQLVTIVIYEIDRKNFSVLPEAFFTARDVCVSGKLELYKNNPAIIVRSQEKINIRNGNNSTANKPL